MRKLGNQGENLAADYLKSKGYNIIKRNFYSKYGEIDIIATNKIYIIFVEVKLRDKNSMVSAVESVCKNKQSKIIKTAVKFLESDEYELQPRFDVIALTKDYDRIYIEHLQNAFDAGEYNEIF
jgi:putative endonuclease